MENTEQYKDSAKAAIKSLGFVGEIFAVTKNEKKLVRHIEVNSKLALSSLVKIKNVVPSLFNVQPINAPEETPPTSDLLSDFREKKGALASATKGTFSFSEIFKALAVAIPFLVSKEVRDKFIAFGLGLLQGAGFTVKKMARIATVVKWASIALLTYYATNKIIQIVKIISATASLAKTMGEILGVIAIAPILPTPDKKPTTKPQPKGPKPGEQQTGENKGSGRGTSTVPQPSPQQRAPAPQPTHQRRGIDTKQGQKGTGAKEAARRNAQSAAAKSHNAKVFVEKANERMQKAPVVPKPDAPKQASDIAKGLKTFGAGAARLANGLLGVIAVGFNVYDAAEKYKSGDVMGATISGTSATLTAVGLGLMATGVAAPVGAVLIGLGTAASLIGYGRDLYNMYDSSKVESSDNNTGQNLNQASGAMSMEEMMAGPDAIIFQQTHIINKPILIPGR